MRLLGVHKLTEHLGVQEGHSDCVPELIDITKASAKKNLVPIALTKQESSLHAPLNAPWAEKNMHELRGLMKAAKAAIPVAVTHGFAAMGEASVRTLAMILTTRKAKVDRDFTALQLATIQMQGMVGSPVPLAGKNFPTFWGGIFSCNN
mmetsp:Transcript_9427/g.28330  ORF Transcript_9427/g.28330 Transcript_9427/m.28330 type:complete len:149 (+) Transcript_9427:265-711(+)